MLPYAILKYAVNHPVMIELKNGETYNGKLSSCDFLMNVTLSDVICTSKDALRFWKIESCSIRGNVIKSIRVTDDTLALAQIDADAMGAAAFDSQFDGSRGRGRGRGGFRGRGSGRGKSSY
ncbi:U6 snRNA-associated Sm-like protein LSm4 [Monocercomonoides exilis]|uniref:U6 snRNA-associated Sm-like protein LSm4 n=1 Tax=Monocercomonoides exilis TaxID=2049356 RepID=UPI0035598FAF|nr:U6 snRNA-associated Sm-like protein LSm4 [Monocercomonoides exilis]|eukprot:MONOS_682.1-p1 / transcript=MONOS_682.1 / gene=MONOS_682 / organism=Monocercomonoides_exilis_PA203 / gene_product=U6 snRNA-associated Sm-like protein LSm4 / transcript_product=U6 snRNA-associated Sm-like protein LSm4 / location=Mono_scaffold00011:151017-151662(-) / protein_length=121 / sequence_SO=supercontig / SO=protein_coding / is_pseudo=false